MDPGYYTEIVFCKTMVSDHFPDLYDEYLNSVVEGV